ncbi:hypothetical protein LCGC14_1129740 [marine sediment metagenome]|uniref:histidine kinase n=1 Tax=marine sediment metagenome TaxID=412755 RepID=A0A0F9M1E2_9ZZZZ|nr:MAG: Signal transduction histidine kinase [Candidatus Lokiarchaeum sp. GC14_75]
MESKIRSSGIDIIGNTPWGTHFCLFYQTKEDLIDILVPYFKAGLENNEYCMWVTSEPLDEKEAEKAIRVAIPNFDEYLLRNQIEIIPYTEWYIKNNEFDSDRVLNGWVDKCNSALEEGFTGLRLTGNTFWLEQKDWNDFKDYEEEINNVIGNFQMMAICTYSLEKCGSVELLDVIQNHQFALIRRENSWSIFKSSEQTRIEQQLKESEILYRTTVNGFQDPLHVINQDLEIILINDVLKQSVKKFNLDTNLVGKTIREAFPFLLDNVLDEYRSVFNNKKPLITVENTFLGGKEITTETRKIPIFDDEENVFQIITIIRDITERKNAEQKLKESEEKWKALSENSPAIVSLLDREHKIFSINRTAPDLSKEEVIGSSVYNYVPPEFLQVARDSFNSVWKTGEPNTYAQKYITKEGETRFFEVWIGPIFQSGKVFALVSHSMDVTEKKQAEQKLKESEEKWRALSENSPAQIALLDLEQKILFINRTAPDLSQDEVIGKSVYIFVPKDYIQIAKESYKLVIDTGKPSSFTTEYISKDGSISFFDVWIGPIFESGKIVTLISHSLDITKRKKAEQKLKESEEKYRTLFESSKDGIIFSNMDGKIMDCNQAYLNMLGYTLVEIQEFSYQGLTPEKWYEMEADIVNNKLLSRGYSGEYEKEYIRKDGTIIPISITVWLIKDDQRNNKGMWAIVRDITERKKAENELKELSKLKSEFLRRASHELKTPLISIKGFSELIISLYSDQLDTSIISKLREINDGCERLENIINNLLKTSRLESTELKPKLQKEDLSFLIKFCVHELESLAERRNQSINLDIQNNLYANIEKEEIHDVLSNLLTNAIKYTPPMGKIEIRTELKEDSVVISVKDNGIGFNNEQKKKIFQQFGKIERYGQGLDLGIDGTGLGLYISKKIVESHGGKIWMESEGKSRGSTFYFTIPTV